MLKFYHPTVNVLKLQTLFSIKILGFQGKLVRMANGEDCTVCLGLFGRGLVFDILEHLPYLDFLSGYMLDMQVK